MRTQVWVVVAMGLVGGFAHANPVADVTCGLDGDGSYVYEDSSQTDFYTWSGEVDGCRSATGSSVPESAAFDGDGIVVSTDGRGPASLALTWKDGSTSAIEGTLTGVPELLVLAGTVTGGRYAGQDAVIELHCKLKDTVSCFQTGSSAWAFLGNVRILAP
jgi:hypothetical protein